MLDLSRPLDPVDGVTLFGDHEQPNVAYYLPDEIGLQMIDATHPDVAMQIFFPDEAISGGEKDLDKSVGAILSLGVNCELSDKRRDDVRSKVASQLGRDDLRLVPPPWEDGSVQLLLLDSASGASDTVTLDGAGRMVLGVVGSKKPSLSDPALAALFHARLDRRGTALVAAALAGEAGSMAGVLYDLSFAALRPAVNLRMSADLNRVADFFKASAGVQVYYVSAQVSASFGKMREQGIIHVDVVSEVDNPEAQKQVDQCVQDFYDTLMRQLFSPTVSPAEALGNVPMGGTAKASIVQLAFSYSHTEHERVVEVDYRKRAATRRTHNPQAHLRQLAQIAGGADSVVQRVPLSAAWRQFEVDVAAPSAFDDPSLRQARVVLWRGKDGVLDAAHARDGGLRMPGAAAPLADLAFSKADTTPRHLAFVTQSTEPPFYRWQAQLTYAPADGVESPAQIWSDPHVSSSSDLDLFPDILAPCHKAVLKLGAGQNQPPTSVEAHLVARDDHGQTLAEHRLTVDATHQDARWSVRRGESDQIAMDASLVYRYPGDAALTRPAAKLIDAELVANDPFMRTVTLTPLVLGAPTDLQDVFIQVHYEDAATGYRADVTRHLPAPGFHADDIPMPVVNADDKVTWTATAVRGSATVPLGHGESAGGIVELKFSPTRRIRVDWLGPTPDALSLRWLRATFRARNGDQVLETETLEWRGTAVDAEQAVTLPADGVAEWSIERRYEDGHQETTPFVAVDSDLLAVQGS